MYYTKILYSHPGKPFQIYNNKLCTRDTEKLALVQCLKGMDNGVLVTKLNLVVFK